ncbi:MAG: NTP transferase domain-containing protein [Treponema sp.]|jgi:spore coat polysaccharide biosynthesis protein SpsF|nr:NTP transferase domain-containing protein [Treponema sp.]
MTALIVQARLDSSRLPGKSLLPLGGRPLIVRVMEALKTLPCAYRILACPPDCVPAFAALAGELGFELVPGPKEDVLARYCLAIRRFSPDRIIRATGDNPFVFADAAIRLHEEALALNADYAGYAGIPYGAGVESVKSEALLRAEREAQSQTEREHVCPYLYNHPEFFLLHRPLAPLVWQGPDIRITVDTPEDYKRAEILYNSLSSGTSSVERYRGEAVIRGARGLFP